jgi:uncharacterized protein (TIGR00369 family)
MMKEVVKYPGCFVCGDKNENGLQARFFFDGQQVVTEVVTLERFEGYRGIYHGGIIATLLDEVMIKAILVQERYAVTAELTVRFHKPVRIGDKIRFTGKVVKSKGRVFWTEGTVTSGDNQVLATATGRYVEATAEMKEALMQSF